MSAPVIGGASSGASGAPGAVSRTARRDRPFLARNELLLVAGCYLLAALIVTAFLWRDPASRIVAGNPADPDQAAWWMRYAASAVAHWRLPRLITPGMNAPGGVNAMWNPSLLAPGVALSPVTLLFGPQVSLNLMLTAGFAGSATAMYWVLRRWGIGPAAAAFGGLAYGFSPALSQSAIGHYDLQFAAAPPLIAHAVARLPRAPVRCGAALGVLAALQLLTAEELLFETGVAIAAGLVVAAACRMRSVPTTESVVTVASGLLVAAGAFMLVAGYPLAIQFLGPLAQHGSPYTVDYFKNDLAGFVHPSTLQLVHSASSAQFVARFPSGAAEYLGYLGWPLLAIVAWTAVAAWRRLEVRVLAVTFLVLEVLSLGGTLLAGGHGHSWIKLPWYWVQTLPLAGSVIPDRFSIVADGCAAALLAIAIDAAWRAWAGKGGKARAVVCLAAVIAVVPLLPAPLPVASVAGVPAGWTQVMTGLRLPGNASVLVVPVPTATFPTPLRWQASSGVPASVVGGYFIGPAPGGHAYVGGPGMPGTALYLNWLWLESGPGPARAAGVQAAGVVPKPGEMSAWISSTGVSAVVAVTGARSPLASYLSGVLGPPAAQSGTVLAWRVPLAPVRALCQAACVRVLGIVCLLSAVAWVYLLVVHGDFWLTSHRLPRVDDSPPRSWPAVVAVVPARNEADMLPLTLPSLLAQEYPGEFSVTLVDDGSADDTARTAKSLGRRVTPLTVLPGRPRPQGWAGKVWAMEQGLAANPAADGYVLFTDADIEWEAGALRALVVAAEGDDRALVSQMALLRAATAWERIIVPAFVYFFAQLYPFRRVSDPRSRVAAAAGGCMLIRRSALEQAGGLSRIRGALIDDVALGTLLKRAGYRTWLGLSTSVRSVRPYPRLADLWHMIARSAYVQLRYSPLLLAGTILGLLFLYAVPPVSLIAWAVATASGGSPDPLTGAAGLAGWILMSRTYLPMLRLYGLSVLRAPTLPLIALMYAGMTADSARRHYRGSAVAWRGRAATPV